MHSGRAFAQVDVTGRAVGLAAAQCLVVLSEDNPRTMQRITEHPAALALLLASIASQPACGADALIKAACIGTVYNLREAVAGDTEHQLFAAIADMLGVDLAGELASAAGEESTLATARQYMQAQRQALEVLANCCTVEAGGFVGP